MNRYYSSPPDKSNTNWTIRNTRPTRGVFECTSPQQSFLFPIPNDTLGTWKCGTSIVLGDVVWYGSKQAYAGAVYWSSYFREYRVSVGTTLTLSSYHINESGGFAFIRRGEGGDTCARCKRPYPIDAKTLAQKTDYCSSCGKWKSDSAKIATRHAGRGGFLVWA